MTTRLTVVVPTHNRAQVLAQTLHALQRQTVPAEEMEVLVIDDGSTDETPAVVESMKAAQIRYIRQEHRGAGAARNRGLALARGEIVLFLDDDIVPCPELVAEHLAGHAQHPALEVGVLGQVVLHPDVPDTPPNRLHVVHRFQALRDGQMLDWRYFMTCNVSVKTRFLRDNHLLFDEVLPRYQDSELAFRGHGYGLKLFYREMAVGYHLHHLGVMDFIRLAERYGETAALLHRRYPELRQLLAPHLTSRFAGNASRRWRELARPFLMNRFTMGLLTLLARWAEARNRALPQGAYARLSSYYQRRGYRRSRQ